jgi:hypothetical protein
MGARRIESFEDNTCPSWQPGIPGWSSELPPVDRKNIRPEILPPLNIPDSISELPDGTRVPHRPN